MPAAAGPPEGRCIREARIDFHREVRRRAGVVEIARENSPGSAGQFSGWDTGSPAVWLHRTPRGLKAARAPRCGVRSRRQSYDRTECRPRRTAARSPFRRAVQRSRSGIGSGPPNRFRGIRRTRRDRTCRQPRRPISASRRPIRPGTPYASEAFLLRRNRRLDEPVRVGLLAQASSEWLLHSTPIHSPTGAVWCQVL